MFLERRVSSGRLEDGAAAGAEKPRPLSEPGSEHALWAPSNRVMYETGLQGRCVDTSY